MQTEKLERMNIFDLAKSNNQLEMWLFFLGHNRLEFDVDFEKKAINCFTIFVAVIPKLKHIVIF